MTLGELIKLARTRLDDLRLPYLWSDAQLTEFANAAQEEVADRTRCIRDDVSLPLVLNTPFYTLPVAPLKIHSVQITDADGVIDKVDFASEAEFNTLIQFGNYVSERPRFYSISNDISTVILHPIPNTTGTVSIEFSRLPTDDELMVSMGDEPIVPKEMHRDMVYWMLVESYSLRDGDIREKNLADVNEAKFERRFGPKISGRLRVASRRIGVNKPVYPVRFGGI